MSAGPQPPVSTGAASVGGLFYLRDAVSVFVKRCPVTGQFANVIVYGRLQSIPWNWMLAFENKKPAKLGDDFQIGLNVRLLN